MKQGPLILIALVVIVGLSILLRPNRDAPPITLAPAKIVRPYDPGSPLATYRGKNLLVVLGMPGCSGTERITTFFSEYAARKPAQVELLRVDVPPPGDEIDSTGPWSAPFKRLVDANRDIARCLDFFFYPTLYAIDRDGVIRFAGPCDVAQVQTMMDEIAAESAPGDKKNYSPSMPAIGTSARAFTGTTLAGTEVTLADLLGKRATLLFFGDTTCPFSRQAAQTLPQLARTYGDKGAAIAIINQGQPAEAIREFYAGQDFPVIVDADSKIGLDTYGVWAVPFFYALDATGTVIARQPYTENAGAAALSQALGLGRCVTLPQSGAG